MCETKIVSCHASHGKMESNWPEVQEVVVSLVRQADYPHPLRTDSVTTSRLLLLSGSVSVYHERQRSFAALVFQFWSSFYRCSSINVQQVAVKVNAAPKHFSLLLFQEQVILMLNSNWMGKRSTRARWFTKTSTRHGTRPSPSPSKTSTRKCSSRFVVVRFQGCCRVTTSKPCVLQDVHVFHDAFSSQCPLHELPLVFDSQQVYDRDLTTDDFMGSATVPLSDLELDKWVCQSEGCGCLFFLFFFLLLSRVALPPFTLVIPHQCKPAVQGFEGLLMWRSDVML